MANKWLVSRTGLGFLPGVVRYIVTHGLEMGSGAAVTPVLITGTIDADTLLTGTIDADALLVGTVDADTLLTGTIGGA